MSVIRRHRTPGVRQAFAGAVAAVILVIGLAVPVGAGEGPTKLFAPEVGPRAGTPTTKITFAVEYRNREGSPAAYVRVVIDGVAHGMASDGSTDWKQGVGHSYSAKLSAGTHKISFEASDTRRFSDTLDGGSVTIAVPTPTPAPTPKPTPKRTPKPTPSPTPATTPGGSSSGGTTSGGGTIDNTGAGTGGPGDGSSPGLPGSGGIDAGSGSPADGSSGAPLPTGLTGAGGGFVDGAGGSGFTFDPRDGPEGPTRPTGSRVAGGASDGGWAGGGSVGGSGDPSQPTSAGGRAEAPTSAGSGSGSAWGPLTSALDTLGIDGGSPLLRVLPSLVGTTGAVAMALAFAIFGKKRRDEEPPAPDEVLQAKAARGAGVDGVVAASAVPAPFDAEAAMPRWRRPSLLEARKADPARTVVTAQRLAFGDEGETEPDVERRVIRYRVVRLLDAPDELRSADIGQLDQGDEVQLLERSGAYWRVLCPDGRQGWIHKMTLGDVVTDRTASSGDAWTGSEDLLGAYLSARGRA